MPDDSAQRSCDPEAAPCSASSAPYSASSREPAAEIARRVATELQQLSSVTARIECAVNGLILNSSTGTSGLHPDLQSLDSLGQMLEGLAQFLNDMATQIPSDWQFDPTKAASSLKLKDLAQRLGTQKQSNQTQNNAQDNAQDIDCEWF